MPVIDMTGLDTQSAPMKAIDNILKEYHQGFLSGVEALNIISVISVEWKH